MVTSKIDKPHFDPGTPKLESSQRKEVLGVCNGEIDHSIAVTQNNEDKVSQAAEEAIDARMMTVQLQGKRWVPYPISLGSTTKGRYKRSSGKHVRRFSVTKDYGLHYLLD